MIALKKSAAAWETDDFEHVLVQEVTDLGIDKLPLQEGLSYSSIALDSQLKIIILNIKTIEKKAIVKMGAFYSGIIAGCSCADDPSPTDEVNEYCEFITRLDLQDGQAEITLSAQGD